MFVLNPADAQDGGDDRQGLIELDEALVDHLLKLRRGVRARSAAFQSRA
jgi:hypothetical protein